MALEQVISTYGYPAVLVGTFLEGETILVMAGFLSHQGYLSLPFVILSAFIGTLVGDQLYFYIGRVKGRSFLEKRPLWKKRSSKIFDLLHRHQNLLLLGFRFVYGIRTVTPFIVGLSHINPFKFLVLNFIGAGIWAVLIGVLGYVLGHSLELLLVELKHYELLVMGCVALIGCFAGIFIWWRSRRNGVSL